MPKRARSFRAAQTERLKDPAYAAEYINAAMEAGDEAAFLLALRNVAEARSVNAVASQAGLSRESVYRMLSGTGNPCYSSLLGIFGALGLQFRIQAVSGEPPEDETTFAGPRLIWEASDHPGPYFSEKLEEFARALRLFASTPATRDRSAGAPEITELAA